MSLEIGRRIVEKGNGLKNGITEFKAQKPSVKIKIIYSAGMGVLSFGFDWGVGSYISLKESARVPDDVATYFGLGIVLTAGALVSLINLNQKRRLLNRFETNQDFPETVIYHSIGRIKSLKEKREGRSLTAVIVPAIVFSAMSAPGFFTFASLSPERMKEAVMLRLIQGGSELVQAGAGEIALLVARTFGKERKRKK